MTVNMGGLNVEALWAHRRAVVQAAPFEPREPAWMRDEDALREAAEEQYGRLLDEGVWDDHRRDAIWLGLDGDAA